MNFILKIIMHIFVFVCDDSDKICIFKQDKYYYFLLFEEFLHSYLLARKNKF